MWLWPKPPSENLKKRLSTEPAALNPLAEDVPYILLRYEWRFQRQDSDHRQVFDERRAHRLPHDIAEAEVRAAHGGGRSSLCGDWAARYGGEGDGQADGAVAVDAK